MPRDAGSGARCRMASVAIEDRNPQVVHIEVAVGSGTGSLAINGIGVDESGDPDILESNLRAGLAACGLEFPGRDVHAEVSPDCSVRGGRITGLAIAAGALCAAGQLDPGPVSQFALLGEVAPSGELLPLGDVAGVARAARSSDLLALVVPRGDAARVRRFSAMTVYEIANLGELEVLARGKVPRVAPACPKAPNPGAWAFATAVPSQRRACLDCLRRGYLLAALSPHIHAAFPALSSQVARELLSLPSRTLAEAVAGKRKGRGVLKEIGRYGIDELAAAHDAAGVWAICQCESEAYPPPLRDLPDAPWAIYGTGDPELVWGLDPTDAVSISGGTRFNVPALKLAEDLGYEVAAGDLTVISTFAFGVDSYAMRGAQAHGRAIAVQPTGVDSADPAWHQELWRVGRERATVISELPPGTYMAGGPWPRLAAARIVAALSGTLVLFDHPDPPASLLSSARIALGLGRGVGVVPNLFDEPSSAFVGLRGAGAQMVRFADDLLEIRGSTGGS